MERRTISVFIGILLLVAFLVWVVTADLRYVYPTSSEPATTEPPGSLFSWQGEQQRSIAIHRGLDLQGGMQVVLEAEVPAGQELQEGSMEAAG
jgi:preprotein translocase subunit SecD